MKQQALVLAILTLLGWSAGPGAQQIDRKQLEALSRGTRLRYNRVEGLFASYRLTLSPRSWKGVKILAESGYGLHNRSPRWEVGGTYRQKKWTFSFAVFDRTETPDREIISTAENNLFTLLFKGDYRDYFRAKNGFEAKGTYRRRRLLFLGRLTAFSYASMPVETEWSLFRKGRAFRANPAVRPGAAGLLQAGFIFDSRVRRPIFRNAWYASAIYERGFREFEYNGLILAVKRRQKVIFGNQAFVLHARIGARESSDEQHRFDLGGVGTLRGYGIKEFTGNRMALLNVDYRFRGDLLGRIPLQGFHLANLVLFFDTGWVTDIPGRKHLVNGFQDLRLTDFESDIGIAVGVTERLLRINLARRLDRRTDAWTFSVRFLQEL